jgi:hypothetical protein
MTDANGASFIYYVYQIVSIVTNFRFIVAKFNIFTISDLPDVR